MAELFAALGVQSRVVHAFILRETRTRFGRSRLGYFWALFEPMAYILTFVGIFTVLERGAPIDVDISMFFFTAIIPWLLFSRMVSSVSGAVDANQQLLSYPHVKTLDVVVARMILEFSTLMLVSLIYLSGGYYLGYFTGIESVLLVMLPLFVVTLLGVGLGLVFGAIKYYMSAITNIQSVFLRILFFASGKFFVADSLPPALRDWLWYNPLLHITEWVRSSFFSSFESRFYDWTYPVKFALVVLFLGLASERVTRYKLRHV